jgi:hypothetical protein
MAMTLGEANDVQILLAWVLDLDCFDTRSQLRDADLLRAVAELAARSHRVLGAGLNRQAAVDALARLLTAPDDPGRMPGSGCSATPTTCHVRVTQEASP